MQWRYTTVRSKIRNIPVFSARILTCP